MSSESSRNKLPFEPQQKKKRKKKQKSKQVPVTKQKASEDASLAAIPEVVNKRIIRRMALFCGIPTSLGLSSFFIFYWIVSQEWFRLPTVVVMLVSLGFFGLGVLGLSYGALSSSWDEDRVGSWWGWEEFRINFKRTTSAWRSTSREVRGE